MKDIEEMLADFIVNEASKTQKQLFFGYSNPFPTEKDCIEIIEQMPDEEFDELIRLFGIPTDSLLA